MHSKQTAGGIILFICSAAIACSGWGLDACIYPSLEGKQSHLDSTSIHLPN